MSKAPEITLPEPEPGGTWLYNRHNTSPHDQWLESTPWSQDGNKRQFLSLGEFQRKLTWLLQAPQVQVGPKFHSDRWQDMLSQAPRGTIHLTLPGLSLANLRTPLSDTPSHRLSIAAYRIITAQWDRGFDSDQWAIVSERVIASLRVVQSTPLILQLDYPDEWERPSTVAKAALILAVAVHTTTARVRPKRISTTCGWTQMAKVFSRWRPLSLDTIRRSCSRSTR